MPDQHRTKRQSQRQVALTRLKCNGRGHRSSQAANVAADEDHRADFRNGAAKAGQDGRNKVGADDHQNLRNGLQSCCTIRDQFIAVARPSPLARAMHKRRDDRNCEDRLRDHHGGRREEQGEPTQGSGTRKGEIEREADDDRRQSEKRVDQDNN
jgi:hypothetical protein